MNEVSQGKGPLALMPIFFASLISFDSWKQELVIIVSEKIQSSLKKSLIYLKSITSALIRLFVELFSDRR